MADEPRTGLSLGEFVEANGGEEAVREIMADHAAGRDYLHAHREELTERYPDERIALLRDRVVAHALDPRELPRLLAEAGVDARRVLVRHMATEERVLAL